MLKNKRFLFTAGILVISFLLPAGANAAYLSQAGMRLGRLGNGASTANDVYVTFKLATTPTSVAKVILTFPTGFTIATNASITPTTANPPATPAAIATPGTLTAASTGSGSNGGTITISGLTSASLTSGSLYEFDIPSGIVTNPTTPGQYSPTVASANSSGTPIDTSTTPTYIYGASANQDQVVVSASVAPSFTFSLSANADTVPKVDVTAPQTSAGVTMAVSTNSPLGYTAYVKSANGSLVSATNPTTPITTGAYDATPDSASAGTTEYGFVPSTTTPAPSASSGSITYNAEYAVVDGTHAGAFNGTSFAPFEYRTGYTTGDSIKLQERVSVAPNIGIGTDYTDTLTVVAAGNY